MEFEVFAYFCGNTVYIRLDYYVILKVFCFRNIVASMSVRILLPILSKFQSQSESQSQVF